MNLTFRYIFQELSEERFQAIGIAVHDGSRVSSTDESLLATLTFQKPVMLDLKAKAEIVKSLALYLDRIGETLENRQLEADRISQMLREAQEDRGHDENKPVLLRSTLASYYR
jgi:hypothetical protein